MEMAAGTSGLRGHDDPQHDPVEILFDGWMRLSASPSEHAKPGEDIPADQDLAFQITDIAVDGGDNPADFA